MADGLDASEKAKLCDAMKEACICLVLALCGEHAEQEVVERGSDLMPSKLGGLLRQARIKNTLKTLVKRTSFELRLTIAPGAVQ